MLAASGRGRRLRSLWWRMAFEEQGNVGDSAGHGADEIERGGEGNRAFGADAAEAGF